MNRAELEGVGRDDKDGSMCYLFNTLSGHFIISVGGGTVYLDDGSWGKRKDLKEIRAIEEFLKENPEGGDVTHLMPKR